MKYYDPPKKRLVCIKAKATSDFWDKHWETLDLERLFSRSANFSWLRPIMAKYVPLGRRVLEGGCGRGQLVYALKVWGYDSFGVDYAPETVKRITLIFPDLQISYGDVRRLNFESDFFSAYLSLGVIEHFYDGFESILKEMKRSIKNGGYLFLTFPHISLLRKLKIRCGLYPVWTDAIGVKDNFYQFILDKDLVRRKFESEGFKFLEAKPLDGVKGLKDEVRFGRLYLQKIYDSDSILARFIRGFLCSFLSRLSSHSILLIFQLSK